MVCLLGLSSWITESSLFFTLQLMVAVSPSITVTLSVARFWPSTSQHKEKKMQMEEVTFWMGEWIFTTYQTFKFFLTGTACKH